MASNTSTPSADKFREIIERDRETREKYEWSGNVLQYLEFVKQDPAVSQLAHSRLYKMLTAPGFEDIAIEDDARLSRIFKNQKLRKARKSRL